jgi:hypothetical protein
MNDVRRFQMKDGIINYDITMLTPEGCRQKGNVRGLQTKDGVINYDVRM